MDGYDRTPRAERGRMTSSALHTPSTPSWSADLAAAGKLPPRYGELVRDRFDALAAPGLRDGATVLDLGSGRDPVYPVGTRPAGLRYLGLDVSAHELEVAPPGSYDEAIVTDAAVPVPALEGRCDLIVSWQVFEHLGDLPATVANLRGYLKPDGRLVAMLSGRFAAFALANAVLPARVGNAVASRVLGVPSEDVFPAHYHHCHSSALRRAFRAWGSVELEPLYRGAVYFRPVPPALAAYLRYENWAHRRRIETLATHYLICASP
jgi:2-polyprenyl-6-hydroxyphenyl methylase/3-demethylubiquinone-9 3-methyltransferase